MQPADPHAWFATAYRWLTGSADALILHGQDEAMVCPRDPDQAVVRHRECPVVNLITDLLRPGERFASILAFARALSLWAL